MSQWWNAGTPYAPANLPEPRSGAMRGVVNGQLWVIGGWAWDSGAEAYTKRSDVWAYDPLVNEWIAHDPVGTPTAPLASCAVLGDTIYAFAAEGFLAYDVATGTLSTLTAPPGTLVDEVPVVAHGGLIYADMTSADAAAYDPVADSWSAVTQAPSGARTGGAMVSDGTSVYHYQAGLMQRYDPGADSWVALATQPTARRVWYPTIGIVDGVILLATGLDTTAFSWQPWLSSYDIASDAWGALADRSVASYGAMGGVIDDRQFVVGGFAATFAEEQVLTVWGDTRPDHTILTVTHDVGWPVGALLVVTHDTSRAGAADAGATLRVTHDTRTGVTATLHVQHDPVHADGEAVSAVPTTGPVVTGSISERVGGGVTAQLQREDGTHPTPADAAFETTEAEAGGVPVKRSVARAVAAAPYGKGWSREGGVPISTLTTPNPNGSLNDTILPELVKVPVLTGGGITYEVPSNTEPRLTSLDAPLGARVAGSDDDCAARMPLDDAGRQTRLELAKVAVAEAGFALVTLGTIPNADRKVERDYTTEGQTASSVLSDMLLASNPRVWYTPTTVFVDGRTFTGAAGTTDPTTFIASGLLADDGASWQDQAGSTEPEPLLADYTDRCEQRDPTATPDPNDEEGVDVPGTFETFENGTYSWTERSGQSVGPFGDIANSTYRAAAHTLTKSGGQLVREVTIVREQYKRDYGFSINQIGPVAMTIVDNDYHPICPEALIGRSERTTQRKRVEDIPNVSNTLADDEDGAFTPDENHEMIYDALPDWYVEEEKFVEQRWHAEGWLRARSETTRQLEGMIASPQFDTEGALSGYEITLTYKTDTRNETYLPIGRGLWHIGTTVKTTQDRPVKELVNPDAVEGDEDYGVMEIVDVMTVPVQNHYTVVTDQAPPQISCGGQDPTDPTDPCGDSDDPYAGCIAEATRRWEIDHADWVARQAHNGPKRVWSIQASRLLPDAHVGQLRGGGVVTSVTHDRGAIGGTTSLEVTEWLA